LFLIRFGCVCLLVTIVACVSQRLPLPLRILHSLSRGSLMIYIVHICILYGSNWNPGLRQWIGPTLSLGSTLVWIAVLLVSMPLLVLTSHYCKEIAGTLLESMRQSATAFAIHYRRGQSQLERSDQI
jgi:peptidoglycan/LPS O-acetylase OafA/YrhL